MPENETEGVKISLLPSATPSDNAVVAGVSGSSTVKFFLSSLKTYITNGITAISIGAVPNTRTINGKVLNSDISLNADDVGAAGLPQTGSISLSTVWSGDGPYTQSVTVTGATVTANSKVDIQLTATQIDSLISDRVRGIVIENNNGTLTAYAVGAVPSAAMTLQVTVTEVG